MENNNIARQLCTIFFLQMYYVKLEQVSIYNIIDELENIINSIMLYISSY